IFDDAHHETVEERYAPIGAGPGLNPPAGEKTEVFEDGVESVFPAGRLLFHRRQRARDAPPRVLDRAVADGVAATEAILRVPDMARNVGVKRVAVHGGYVTRGRTAAARKRAVPRVGNDKQPGGDLSRIGRGRRYRPALYLPLPLLRQQLGDQAEFLRYVFQDVVERDDSREVTLRGHDRRSSHALLPHEAQGFVYPLRFLDDEQASTHDVFHGYAVEGNFQRDDFDHDIAIRDDTDRVHAIGLFNGDQQIADVMLPHQARRFHDARIGRAEYDIARANLTDVHIILLLRGR